MRFSSHRDFARAFERSLRRAEIPMAYSAGFHPHPKISYVGAAPTGVGSEAEYLEIALAERQDPEQVRAAIDAVLPAGLDIVAARDVAQCPAGSLADQIHGSRWQLEFGDAADGLPAAVAALLAEETVLVDRLTKDGKRSLDARAAIVWVSLSISSSPASNAGEPSGTEAPAPGQAARGLGDGSGPGRAILDMVVRQVTPTVRPDDVLTALQSVAGFAPSQPPRATRLAQGPIDEAGAVGDPLGITQFVNNQTPVGTR
jgi:radical SAM-linked protein